MTAGEWGALTGVVVLLGGVPWLRAWLGRDPGQRTVVVDISSPSDDHRWTVKVDPRTPGTGTRITVTERDGVPMDVHSEGIRTLNDARRHGNCVRAAHQEGQRRLR